MYFKYSLSLPIAKTPVTITRMNNMKHVVVSSRYAYIINAIAKNDASVIKITLCRNWYCE